LKVENRFPLKVAPNFQIAKFTHPEKAWQAVLLQAPKLRFAI
jgi:hypothetical protein